MKISGAVCLVVMAAGLAGAQDKAVAPPEPTKKDTPTMRVESFKQEVAVFFDKEDGLEGEAARAVAIDEQSTPYVGTDGGLFYYNGKEWARVSGVGKEPIMGLTTSLKGCVYAASADMVYEVRGKKGVELTKLPSGTAVNCIEIHEGRILVGTDHGLFSAKDDEFKPVPVNELLGDDKDVRAIAIGDGIVIAAKGGLFWDKGGNWHAVTPRTAARSWAPYDVRGAAFDGKGRLWFASPQGVGCIRAEDDATELYTPEEGVPYDDFTCVGANEHGEVVFGTTFGAVRYDGKHWAYRQGRRWLQDDEVHSAALTADGDAWFATDKGVSVIEARPMTLAEKAKYYEDEIDKYHRRTEYGFVIEAQLESPGDKTKVRLQDSDNDGLWTSMYGAGECFAYGATKSPEAKKRAKAAFEALRFLGEVTQGGTPAPQKGFVARSVLPTSGHDPNAKHYTVEKDRIQQQHDEFWKVMSPRWPTSVDGKWYWKCDTSSDELDGHYFFYAAYHDLVADTPEEKDRVRTVVDAISTHLLENKFNLVDWDGKPTRWAIFGPESMNQGSQWFEERGLNSLSILSYLAVAYHVTQDAKYKDAFTMLVRDHAYALNMMWPKYQFGPGSGNQSDDEMAFMSFYNLRKYSPDPEVSRMAAFAFRKYWLLVRRQLNAFFNFAYAGTCFEGDAEDLRKMSDARQEGPWLEQSVDTLKRFPLDRCSWRHVNSKRKDVTPLEPITRDYNSKGLGYRNNGYVIPVDESFFGHYNYDSWGLDSGDNGSEMGTGTVFLLPYYMGLYHGFITEE